MRDDPRYRVHSIGDRTYGAPLVLEWGEGAKLTIGRFCSIAEGVAIFLGGEHRPDWISTYPFKEMLDLDYEIPGHPSSRGDVIVGNDVWIGRGAMIRSGVIVGDGAVIGMGAVVTKDVEPYAVVAGNPARTIRRRFGDQAIAALLQIRWWDWDADRVREAIPLLSQTDVDLFLQFASREGGPANFGTSSSVGGVECASKTQSPLKHEGIAYGFSHKD